MVDGLDCEIEPQCIATIPQHPGNGDEDFGPVVFLNLHKSIKKTLEAWCMSISAGLRPGQWTPNRFKCWARPKSMKSVLGLGLACAADFICGNVSPDQIWQSWQGIITSTPGKVLKFIWNSKLPQIPPKLPLILRQRCTYMISSIASNKKLIGTLSCKHTRGSKAPYNTVRRKSCA